MSNSSEIQALLSVAQQYFDAIYFGDTQQFALIFHEDARLYCTGGGEYVTMGLEAYLEVVRKRGTPASRNDRRQDVVLSISIPTDTTAHLRVSELFLPKRFTDELTLLKQGDQWRIVRQGVGFRNSGPLDIHKHQEWTIQMSFEPKFETSAKLMDAYIARSWRSNAERQRAKGADFIIGKREGVYMWNLEGTHKIIDCGVGGGVHSLGHRHPDVLAALRKALDDGRDTGLWSVPNEPYLILQDRLAELAPSQDLTNSVVTLCSTLSVDVSAMFSLRVTGRSKILAYAHGYHGHSGFAAMVTGSKVEGVIEHYNLPTNSVTFFDNYGDINSVEEKMTDDVAAIIIEPMDYESFQFATQEYMDGVTQLCHERGVLFIVDETRTGLGRTGRLWASEHYELKPDMMVIGKGLSGGLYPVSALLARREIYETCMNEHQFSYISSLGGNEISCIVALSVLDLSRDPVILNNVNAVSEYLRTGFLNIVSDHPNLLGPVHTLGCVQSVSVADMSVARTLYGNLFKHGVLCHSVCEVGLPTLKFFPPIVLTHSEADEVVDALRASIADL